jgi:hypothetical protein
MDAFDDTRLAATLDADVWRFGKAKPIGKSQTIQCDHVGLDPDPHDMVLGRERRGGPPLRQNEPRNVNDFNSLLYPSTVPVA